MTTLYVDIETRAPVSLSDVGAHRYFEQGGQVLLVAFAQDDEDVLVADGSKDSAWMIQQYVNQSDLVVAHNMEFDSLGLTKMGVHIPLDKQHCTLAQAAAHGLPGGLDDLSDIFLPSSIAKLKEGKKLIKLFCQPDRKGVWHDESTDPILWQQFVQYAARDVEAMRALHKKLPLCNWAFERPVWEAHRRVNARGFRVDEAFCASIMRLIETERETAAASVNEITGGAVSSPTQTAKLKAWLESQGVVLGDMREATLEAALLLKLNAPAREAIRLRLFCAKASSGKYQAALDRVQDDGRLRGTLQYCGARRTGRWSGYGIQPQNFARPTLANHEIDAFIEACVSGCADLVKDPDISYSDYGKQCVRGLIVAEPGHQLVVADLANIEGRVTAYLAGGAEKLAAFTAFDAGVGQDLYKVAYASAFGVNPNKVTKAERQLGKVFELALGYGGGVNALLTGLNAYKMDPQAVADAVGGQLPEHLQNSAQYAYDKETLGLPRATFTALWCLTRMWRQSELNAPIAKLWATLEAAVRDVIKDGRPRRAGLLVVDRPKPSWLRVKLPSGRYLMYARPHVGEDNKVTFHGMRPTGAGWGECKIWGGTFVENAAQAFARDILASAVSDIEAQGGNVVLTVHDEVIVESEENSSWQLPRVLSALTKERSWTKGMPLAAAGFTTKRYCKE